MLNESIRYEDGKLYCDAIPISEIVAQTGTPVYIYSLRRALNNLRRIQSAFSDLQPHIHYSAKANANLSLLKALIGGGAGIDAVSAGEIHKAFLAGAQPEAIVFAGVGKTASELEYAIEKGVGWINVENVSECRLINDIVARLDRPPQRIALRLNPDVTANTHPYIATGHGGAKFGLTADSVRDLLQTQNQYPHICFEGIHIHIGSQLHDTIATGRALQIALDLIAPYPSIQTVNIGGGLPVTYHPDEQIPSWENFAKTLVPLLKGYQLLLEPGRSIIADAGLLVASILYIKKQAGQTILITDGSMTELIRPALYKAHHEIIPVHMPVTADLVTMQVVGPVCETADIIGRDINLPEMQEGELLAVLTTGAYGMVMASNYNQRPRPPEVMVAEDGQSWHIARRRETWDDLVRLETLA
jgi:diaminopimelate decarboxylase